MRVKIVVLGHFTNDTHFKIEDGLEGKELKVGDRRRIPRPRDTRSSFPQSDSASPWSSRCRWRMRSLRNCTLSPARQAGKISSTSSFWLAHTSCRTHEDTPVV